MLLNYAFMVLCIYTLIKLFDWDRAVAEIVLGIFIIIFHFSVFFLPRKKVGACIFFLIFTVPLLLLLIVNIFVWLFLSCCKEEEQEAEGQQDRRNSLEL